MDELREAFDEAWEESEGEETESGTERAEGLAEEASEQSDESTVTDNEDDGYDEKGAASEKSDDEGQKGQGVSKETEAKPDTDSGKATNKAPASWTPGAREGWSKVPADVQAQINKREAQMSQHMQNSAESTKAIKQLKTVMEPYQNSMMAAGVKDPFKVIGSLMNNDNIMRHGQSQDKAHLVASMIQRFGVDINTLDELLSGQPASQQSSSQGGGQVQDMIRQEMAPFHQMMQQQEVQRQTQSHDAQQSATNDVSKFSQGKEFMEDVRHTMADFMDMASSRGQEMTLDQAYAKACALDPEISKIQASRAKEQSILGNNNLAKSKRNAASSITGSRGGLNSAGGGNTSMRDTIANAWNDMG
tara:strand:+ start:1354 stop:2436 length:1083 start_codon:yes stop_codon:yes gene_type:complete